MSELEGTSKPQRCFIFHTIELRQVIKLDAEHQLGPLHTSALTDVLAGFLCTVGG